MARSLFFFPLVFKKALIIGQPLREWRHGFVSAWAARLSFYHVQTFKENASQLRRPLVFIAKP